jgi:uncharacterized glyoxalase superfamily protein PhnB
VFVFRKTGNGRPVLEFVVFAKHRSVLGSPKRSKEAALAFEMWAVTPMLQAKSLEETIAFYTKTLGFTVDRRVGHWCALSWGGARVMFYSGLEHTPDTPAMTGVLYFNPKDVKALWEEVKGKAPVEWELQVMDYGMLEFAIRDCNGYVLSFGQETTSEK